MYGKKNAMALQESCGNPKPENRKSQRLTIPSPKTNTVAMQTGAM